jgi:hypothetical protein
MPITAITAVTTIVIIASVIFASHVTIVKIAGKRRLTSHLS